MRPPRLPPLDTSEYISFPIDTPLLDFDQKSPLPCIIVTPSSPTEYHIAFHHKSSPLHNGTFAAQQQQQQPRPRRAFLNTLTAFVAPPVATAFDVAPPNRGPFKARMRTTLVLAISLFIIVCHMLASVFLRGREFRSALFGSSIARGGFSSAAAHMRAQRNVQPLSEPQIPNMYALD